MRNIFITTIAALAMFTTAAMADYTFLVPQKPGGGTSQWAQIIATELEPFLGEPIRIIHHPGARDIPGFNLWHNDYRDDDKTVMVSHGGNGVSFLQENVDYDYREYASVGLMNLNIIVASMETFEPFRDQARMAAGSGQVPEAMAMALLLCGPGLTMEQYVECFGEQVLWVNGMSGGERRLAFQREELNVTRENPAAFKKHVQPLIDEGRARVLFHHGLLDAMTGGHVDDPNYPDMQMELIFKRVWKVEPSGPMYDAYKLVKSFRDGMQKALWMDPSNPNLETVRAALLAMSQDPSAQANILKAVGDYEWLIGDAGDDQRDTLMTFVTVEALENLVYFNKEALGLASVFKPELAK